MNDAFGIEVPVERHPTPPIFDLNSLFWSTPMRRLIFVPILAALSGLASAQTPTIGGCQVFPANNIWNTPIDKMPVAANSAAYISSIGASHPLKAEFGTVMGFRYSLVSGSQAKFGISFTYSDSDAGPYPLPGNLWIEPESDGHAMIVDTTNCVLYELFKLARQSNGSWRAGAGAIFHLNSNALRPNGWTSADAAGLPMLPGFYRYDEVASGHINHAVRFTGPYSRNTHIWPARHNASSRTGSEYPQFGQRFRLKADFDISSFSPHIRVILQAMKTYGLYFADNGLPWDLGGITDSRWNNTELKELSRVVGADLEAVDESSLMIDPNSGQAGVQSSGKATGWTNIISRNSGKCLSIGNSPYATASGNLADQWTCVGGTNQEFQLTPVTGGYKITVRNSNLQVGVRGGVSAIFNGSLIQQSYFTGTSDQIWVVTRGSDGYYTLKPSNTGKCMDVVGKSKADGAGIQQYGCWGGANQEWSFSPAS
jgi:ricin-type beta-trefoil lectin protein